MTALPVHVAAFDTGTRCEKCRGKIRAGQEFGIEQWPNRGGFDHYHVECPEAPGDPDPGSRVVQGHDRPRRRA